MGNKLSVGSTSSCQLSFISPTSQPTPEANHDRTLNNVISIPKYLKPVKYSKKHHRERLERQQQQQLLQQQQQQHAIRRAALYQRDIDQKGVRQDNNNETPNPPFVFIQKDNHFTLEVKQEQQKQKSLQDLPVIDHDGPKSAFQWFEGRRYHNQDDSILPNDERELDRLRVLNYILRWALEGDFVAPVKSKLLEGTHVLSVGCGPGIWLGHPVIDFALDYNKSQFTAVDVLDLLPEQDIYRRHDYPSTNHHSHFNFSPLHPMLPTTISSSTWHQQHQQHRSQLPNSMPKTDSSSSSATSTPYFSSHSSSYSNILPTRTIFDNLDIYALDIREHGLPFGDNSFELVMQRLSTPAYSISQWNDVIGELIRVTRPGGYIQFIEIDYNAQGLGPYGQAWQDNLCAVLDKTRNLDPFMASHIDTMLMENGLVNVTKKKISIPFGPWGLDIGVLWQQNLEAFIEASAPALGLALGISAAEYIAGWQEYKDELKYVKAFANVYAVWGSKPESIV
ncbi:hypothetical protein BCR42DRAFT_14064 [Absidia repens]|uniref:Methyltransferase type 11 domain-containing protein n=1 Tax=Absidia repens TaxID=90262 RepID=A0A1X2J1R3_9FUNG|nr:hypothetical protein BCR42DRAFT_14064 [Absidia repens]